MRYDKLTEAEEKQMRDAFASVKESILIRTKENEEAEDALYGLQDLMDELSATANPPKETVIVD